MFTSTHQTLDRRPNALPFHDFKERAHQERAAYLRGLAANVALPIPELSAGAKRKLTMFVAALGIATGAFWAVILTSPPQTSAAQEVNMPVFEMMRNAPLDLSRLDADAI